MAKKTITKEHPITAFRKANEARQSIVKKSLIKAQNGISYNGSQLANEYAKAPMAGAEPAWSAIELEKQNAKGPRTGLNTYVSPYNQSNTIYTNSKGVNTNTQGSNVMNDPRFSNAMEKTNTFYNKEKQAGTLNTKGFNKRYNAAKDLDQKGINTINSQKKKGGTVKSSIKKMQTGGEKVKESGKDAYYKNNTQNFKEYKATTDGTVKSTRKSFPDKPSKPAMETTQSMDTTGYAKGKKSFKLTNSSVDLIDKKVYGAKPKVTVKNISRNDVKKVIGGMKSNIGKASKKK